jgi:hypothetical protein
VSDDDEEDGAEYEEHKSEEQAQLLALLSQDIHIVHPRLQKVQSQKMAQMRANRLDMTTKSSLNHKEMAVPDLSLKPVSSSSYPSPRQPSETTVHPWHRNSSAAAPTTIVDVQAMNAIDVGVVGHKRHLPTIATPARLMKGQDGVAEMTGRLYKPAY